MASAFVREIKHLRSKHLAKNLIGLSVVAATFAAVRALDNFEAAIAVASPSKPFRAVSQETEDG